MRKLRLFASLIVFILLVAPISGALGQVAQTSQDTQAAFRRTLFSHHMVVTAEWHDPQKPQIVKRSSGTLSIVAKVEDQKGATFYGVTNFHVGAPDFKSLAANVEFLVGVLIVDEKIIARRYMFPAKLVAADREWDRLLIQVLIPRSPRDLGEEFLKRLSDEEFPTSYDYDALMREIVPARFADITVPPARGTQLWLAGFAGGKAPRIIELSMNFEDLPGRYQFNFSEFQLPRVWTMDVVSPPVAGMSGGFVYNNSGEVVGLFHGHFAVQNVAILAVATPAPDVRAWVIQELAKVGVRP